MSDQVDFDALLAVPFAALLSRPHTASELASLLGARGISLSASTARRLMHRMSELGLAHVAGQDGDEPAYAATALGERMAASTLTLRPELATGLEELERLRSDLLATIGHELRTPLTSIRTSVGLLLDPGLSPSDAQRQQLLATIARSADRVQDLLTDLLDFARLRSGAFELQLEPLDARDIAREVALALEPLVTARSQAVRLELGEDAVPVRGDHRRLDQALLNLAGNAQKFTPTGGEIVLRLRTDPRSVRWEVTDQGPGIGPEDQARLFERFFVGRSDRGGRRGIGLGLPTALAIAQAHGGTIEVDSERGRGSTFSLVVPRGDR